MPEIEPQKRPQIFIITGHNRVGKTTLANALAAESGVILPFGGFLKRELVEVGFPQDYLDKKTVRARNLMRAYGDARREMNPHHFTDKWESEAAYYFDEQGVDIICDDVYHHNELKRMLNFAFKRMVTPTLIIVDKDSIRPSDDEISQFDSVREATEIQRMLDPDRNAESGKLLAASDYYTDGVVAYNAHHTMLLMLSAYMRVFNAFGTSEAYERFLRNSVIPELRGERG